MTDQFKESALKLARWYADNKKHYQYPHVTPSELHVRLDALVAAMPDPRDELLAAVDELLIKDVGIYGRDMDGSMIRLSDSRWKRLRDAYDAYKQSLEPR